MKHLSLPLPGQLRRSSACQQIAVIYKLGVPLDEVEREGTGFTGLTTIQVSQLYRFHKYTGLTTIQVSQIHRSNNYTQVSQG